MNATDGVFAVKHHTDEAGSPKTAAKVEMRVVKDVKVVDAISLDDATRTLF